MTKAKMAEAFVLREFQRGLPVYLFEVADFFTGPTSFANAQKVMTALIVSQQATRFDGGQTNPRYEAGARFYRTPGK